MRFYPLIVALPCTTALFACHQLSLSASALYDEPTSHNTSFKRLCATHICCAGPPAAIPQLRTVECAIFYRYVFNNSACE